MNPCSSCFLYILEIPLLNVERVFGVCFYIYLPLNGKSIYLSEIVTDKGDLDVYVIVTLD